ncbi:hypothetical protein LJC11_04410 [Bacteroidales bacterium OttesenSCG-928-I21]|nr:hypothetical protein [Bacteroidales bacterium OttesenSCG-928-I21]
MKIVKILPFILIVLLIATIVALSIYSSKQAEQITFQKKQIESLNENLSAAISKTAISFTISPEITNKVTSAFGSTKNVTLQYYFTLDGQAMIVKPDSTYCIVKEY